MTVTISRNDWLFEKLRSLDCISEEDFLRINLMAESGSQSLVQLISSLGLVSDDTIAEALVEFHDIPLLSHDQFPTQAVKGYQFSAKFLRKSEVLPIADTGKEIIIAITDPNQEFATDSIRMICNKPVQTFIAPRARLIETIDALYGQSSGNESKSKPTNNVDTLSQWADRIDDTPSIRWVNDLIQKAVRKRASDIHIEPTAEEFRIRYRIDGVLHPQQTISADLANKVCARIKLVSNLDVAERRLPQSGRFQFNVDGASIDIRISTMPQRGGEGIVLRMLDRRDVRLPLDKLGFKPELSRAIESCLNSSQGLLLITGPTGSGKTTSLYSALDKLNSQSRKLMTVEEPIEYELSGVNQIQVRPELDLTFAVALRSVLRQDPDVIMIGEIRDPETAKIGVQAALTGHLVLSTLHTNEAAAAFPRLIDMGIKPYLLASTVSGVLAQRLVRRLCSNCRVETSPDKSTLNWLSEQGVKKAKSHAYKADGCEKCNGTGFFGRTALGEFIAVDDELTHIICQSPDTSTIRHAARVQGSASLLEDAALKVLDGTTTVSEILRCGI